MKRKTIWTSFILLGIVTFLTLSGGYLFLFTPSVSAEGKYIAPTTNLQQEIDSAKKGDTLQLGKGDYGDSNTPITINKAITIEGAGANYDETEIVTNIVIEGTTAEDTVTLKRFSTAKVTPSKDVTYVEIKSPVNLVIDDIDIWQIYRSDVKKYQSHCLKITGDAASGSNVTIQNTSRFAGWYDAIAVENASNTTITIDHSEVEGQHAFNLNKGNGNKVIVKNNSTITGRANFMESTEGIAIVEQQNLNMEIHDSKIIGTIPSSSVKDSETHVFSFDGDGQSNNVTISIDGNSTIEDKSKATGSSVINFGQKNTADHKNVVKIAGTVNWTMAEGIELGPKTKYNEADDKSYFVVGIHDRKMNATIKAYDKEQEITDLTSSIKDKTEVNEEGKLYRFKGWYTDKDYTKEYADGDYTTPPTENMDIYGKYVRLYQVKIGEQTYKVEKGKKLNDLEEVETIKEELEKLKQGEKTFKHYANSNDPFTSIGTTVDEVINADITDDMTIIAEHTITVKIQGSEFSKTIDEGTTYDDFYSNNKAEIESAVNKDGKKFAGFSNEPENFTQNIELIPTYTVHVTIKGTSFAKDIADETSYESFSSQYLEEIKGIFEEKNKTFKEFTNKPEEKFTANIELEAKCSVTVKIKDSEFSKTIDEGTTYETFASTYESEINNAVEKEEKTFTDFASKPDTFTEHTTLEPKYTVKVTIQKKDGSTEEFTLEEGKSLSSLSGENKIRFEETKKAIEYNFTGFIEQQTNTPVKETDAITKHMTLITQFEKKVPNVLYQSHVEKIGWQTYVKNGTTSGTTGQTKRVEAIRIEVENTDYSGEVSYRTHVEKIGWQDYVGSNAISGTTGQAKRIEAIEIKLTGELADKYDIYYRVHCATYGWLDWAKNGASAGTTGFAKRMEAIEIKLVEKDGEAPGPTEQPFIEPLLNYRTHVQTIGWQGYVNDGSISGTTGQGKRLEAIELKLIHPEDGGISYQTHVEKIGWQDEVENGKLAGTTGQAKRLEAIRIKLTGRIAEKYDIYYRVHSATYGWLDWAKNGASAGTEGLAKRLEAIEIRLVPKDSAAPGSTKRPFISK